MSVALTFSVLPGDLEHPSVRALLHEHLSGMADHSPPESIHALQIEELAAPEVTFWCVWHGHELAGCGALKELDSTHGEIKTMRTATNYLRQGVAAQMLDHIIREARNRGYTQLSLETGSADAFQPAQRLYQKFGFSDCGPFGGYKPDPFSVFMSKVLA